MSEPTKGQDKRKIIHQRMKSLLPKYCPNPLDKIANLIAYELYLSPYTVRYTYLPMFVDVGVLIECGDGKYTTKQSREDLPST